MRLRIPGGGDGRGQRFGKTLSCSLSRARRGQSGRDGRACTLARKALFSSGHRVEDGARVADRDEARTGPSDSPQMLSRPGVQRRPR